MCSVTQFLLPEVNRKSPRSNPPRSFPYVSASRWHSVSIPTGNLEHSCNSYEIPADYTGFLLSPSPSAGCTHIQHFYRSIHRPLYLRTKLVFKSLCHFRRSVGSSCCRCRSSTRCYLTVRYDSLSSTRNISNLLLFLRVLQSLYIPAIWLHRNLLPRADSAHLQKSDRTRPHLCKLAWHGLWPVRKRFIRDHVWQGRSKPGLAMKLYQL